MQNSPIDTSPTDRHAIAFIDPRVPDYQSLADAVLPGTEIIILDPNRDGIEQISQALAQRSNISTVHIVSHGSPDNIQLGTASLTPTKLSSYASQLQKWEKSLTSDADILLYGCNIAARKNANGRDLFLDRLADLTGADVAASDNLTGDAAQGGDWNLEYTTGSIESVIPFTQTTYRQVLAVPLIEDTSITLPDTYRFGGFPAWADYNGDGKVDLILTNTTESLDV